MSPSTSHRVRAHRFRVGEQDVGLRLDQLLARHVPEMSRGQAKRVLELGGVFVDRKRVKVARRQLRPGQTVEVYVGSLLARSAEGGGGSRRTEDLGSSGPLPIVRLEDEHVIVVDKPAGVLSAPTPESDRSNLQSWLTERTGQAVFLVHRLDRLTSGLMVFARTSRAAGLLGAALQQRLLAREYLLAASGNVPFERQEVSTPVRGKEANSTFWVVARQGELATLLGARLATGRTHQIRVHAAHLGHAVLGDPVYGIRPDGSRGARGASPLLTAHAARHGAAGHGVTGHGATPRPPRLALHAARLAFPHPASGQRVELESPWPDDLAAWWASLGA